MGAGRGRVTHGLPMSCPNANDKRQVLVNAVELYKKGEWVTGRAEDWKSDEEFGFEGIDDDASDIDSD